MERKTSTLVLLDSERFARAIERLRQGSLFDLDAAEIRKPLRYAELSHGHAKPKLEEAKKDG